MLINLDGNIVNRFGDRFPVPFMEKINVNNTHIDIDLSFYFMKDNADEGDVLSNDICRAPAGALQISFL